MRSVLLTALLTTLLLTACEGSDTFHGRLLLADGSPARGYWVSFDACSVGVTNPTVLTGDDGRYDLPPGRGRDCVIPSIRFRRPTDGAFVAQLDLPYDGRDLEDGPDVRLWDARLVARTEADGDLALTWSVPAELAGAAIFADAEANGPYGPETIWWTRADGPGATLPARGVEDRAARVGVSAQQALANGYWLTLGSDEVALAPASIVSLARHASCTVGDTHGDTTPVVDAPWLTSDCPLTDGGYSAWVRFGCASPCVRVEHATIDLGAATLVSAVAVHDLELGRADGSVDVQLSADGRSFTTVATVPFPAQTYALYDVVELGPTQARFVRISSPDGAISRIAELGVF